jgi:hypothetical protein
MIADILNYMLHIRCTLFLKSYVDAISVKCCNAGWFAGESHRLADLRAKSAARDLL